MIFTSLTANWRCTMAYSLGLLVGTKLFLFYLFTFRESIAKCYYVYSK
jgi:hypothetical protein